MGVLNKLPAGWKWAKLEDVVTIVSGTTPSTGKGEYWNGDIVWITPTDLGQLENDHISASSRRITKEGLSSCNLKLIPKGSVVLSSRAPIGHLAIAKVELCTNQGCKSFVPKDRIDTVFLFYALKISVPQLKEIGSGATFSEISKSQLAKFEIPLPPLSEQKRIVKILNDQLVAVEKARQAAQIQLQAAKAFPAACLKEVFESEEAKKWEQVRIGEVAELVNGRAYGAEELLDAGKYPVLRVGNLFTSDHWYYSDLELQSNKYCEKGDLLYAWSASFGPFIWSGPQVIFHYHIWKVNCSDRLSVGYAYHALESITAKIKAGSHGIGMLHMTKTGMEQFEIPLPPLSEQRRLAKILNDKTKLSEQLRQFVEEQENGINSISASLLRKAFEGEL